MSEERDILSEFHDAYQTNDTGWTEFMEQAALNMDYYFGAQHTPEDVTRADLKGRILYAMNKIKRQVNLLAGYEIRNRHILKIGPVEDSDDHACVQHTGVVMHLMNRRHGYDVTSDAFKWGPLISGSNLVEFWKDRNGDLRFYRHGYNGFLLNPMVTQTDLSDCDDIMTGHWLSEDKVKVLLPKGADKIKSIPTLKVSPRWDRLGLPPMANAGELRLYEQWWRRKQKSEETVIIRLLNQEMPFKEFVETQAGGNEDAARYAIKNFRGRDGRPLFTKYSKPYTVIELNVFVDDELVASEPNPLLMDDYNMVWFPGDWCPESDRPDLKCQSHTSSLRDPQNARNRRICQALDIIESQIQSARVARAKYIKNVDSIYKSGQLGTPIIAAKDMPDTMPLADLIFQMKAPDVNPGLFGMMEILDKDEVDIGGMNEEIFGSDTKDIPGILARFRTGQALTGHAGLFQNFRRAKVEIGRKLVRLVQLNYPPEKIYRIINEWPVQGFFREDFERFDCSPTEGLETDSQKQLAFAEFKELLHLFPNLLQITPPSAIVDMAPIQFGRKMKQIIKQGEQQQQQQMAKQTKSEEAVNNLMQTQAMLNAAKTKEEISEIQSDRVDDALTRAKTVTEIGKAQDDRILALIDRVLKLEEIKAKKTQARKAKK